MVLSGHFLAHQSPGQILVTKLAFSSHHRFIFFCNLAFFASPIKKAQAAWKALSHLRKVYYTWHQAVILQNSPYCLTKVMFLARRCVFLLTLWVISSPGFQSQSYFLRLFFGNWIFAITKIYHTFHVLHGSMIFIGLGPLHFTCQLPDVNGNGSGIKHDSWKLAKLGLDIIFPHNFTFLSPPRNKSRLKFMPSYSEAQIAMVVLQIV